MTKNDCASLLKSHLADRKPLLVVNIDYSNASLVEFLGRNGADILFIDCEQGDTNIETIPDLVRAAHIADTPVIARLFSPEPWVIERYMLRGIDGVVIPRLDTADQVQNVVDTVKYCFQRDWDKKAIVVQIESATAARNLEQILEIGGVDALFIGPVDLSKSMGQGGDYNAPEVAAEIDRLIGSIASKGRSAGMLVTHETIHEVAAKGANFLYLHTNDFLRAGITHFAEAKTRCLRSSSPVSETPK